MNHPRRERQASRLTRVVALGAVMAVVLAACGSSRKSDSSGNGATTTPGATTPVIDTSQCPAGGDTTGVSGNTITIGTSLPESGLYAAFTAILKGERSYFDYV